MRTFLRLFIGAVFLLLYASIASSAIAEKNTVQTFVHTISLDTLGFSEALPFKGVLAERVVSVPVETGLRPVAFSATLKLSPTVRTGVFSVQNNERTLNSYELPFKSPEKQILIPLSEKEVVDDVVTLKLKSVLNPDTSSCAAYHLMWAELSNAKLHFKGKVSIPENVASFWPTHLESLTVFANDPPSAAEAEAIFSLVSHAARLARSKALVTKIRPRSELADYILARSKKPSSQAFHRAVVLSLENTSELKIERADQQVFYLKISSSKEKLAEVVHNSLDIAKKLMVSDRAIVSSTSPMPRQDWREVVTLKDLGYSDLRLQGNGSTEYNLTFSQADVGGSIENAGLRISGKHSPIPEGSNAYLAVLFNGGLVNSVPLSGTGSFDFYSYLPTFLVRRDNNLALRLHYTPPGRLCRLGTSEIILSINNNSYLELNKGQALPPGFERFPQIFLPRFQVAFDKLSLASVQAASDILSALQLLTKEPLRPSVASWTEAAKSELPLLAIAATSSNAKLLDPLLDSSPFMLIDSREKELLRVNPGIPFSLLQAYTEKNKHILLLTHHRNPEGFQNLGSYLSRGEGWYDLGGDVLLLPAERASAQNFRLKDSGVHHKPLPENSATLWVKYRAILFFVTLVLIAMFLFWAYPKIVRKRPL